MDQIVFVPASAYNNNNKSLNTQAATKLELAKYQTAQNPTYQINSLKTEINKKLLSKANSLVGKNLPSPRIKLSSSQTLTLDGVETRVVLSDIAQPPKRENTDVPGIHFTRRCWYVPNSDYESKCQNHREKKLGHCHKMNIKSSKVVHVGRCCLWLCAQFSENQQPTSIKDEIVTSETYIDKTYTCYASIQEEEGFCNLRK